MRASHLTIDLTALDLADLVHDFIDDDKITFDTITESGIKGQVRFLVWNIDFLAQPSCNDDGEVSINITAHKLVPIPAGIVERSLREAVKDAPDGIEVLQQALKLNIPSLLSPLGINLSIRQLRAYDGFLRIALANLKLPSMHDLQATLKKRRGGGTGSSNGGGSSRSNGSNSSDSLSSNGRTAAGSDNKLGGSSSTTPFRGAGSGANGRGEGRVERRWDG